MTALVRRVAPFVFALAFATGLLAAPSVAPPVRAATPDLTIVSDARYDVQPAQKRVRVTVTMQLANHLTDTVTKRYYFDQAFLAVLPGSSGFSLTGGAGSPAVSVSSRSANATILRLTLGSRLFSGTSATYTLRFDLVDHGGAATRDLRIGDSLASFPVWAYASGSTSGSTVTVVFPAGYSTTVDAGNIPPPTTDGSGRTVYRTGPLATPLTFFAYLVADRPGAYTERSLTTTVGGTTVPLTVRAWADDAPFSKRIGDLVKRALAIAAVAPLTPAAFRDATGTSRRYVLVILEDLDRRGLLRRTDAGHVLGSRTIARMQERAARTSANASEGEG